MERQRQLLFASHAHLDQYRGTTAVQQTHIEELASRLRAHDPQGVAAAAAAAAAAADAAAAAHKASYAAAALEERDGASPSRRSGVSSSERSRRGSDGDGRAEAAAAGAAAEGAAEALQADAELHAEVEADLQAREALLAALATRDAHELRAALGAARRRGLESFEKEIGQAERTLAALQRAPGARHGISR